MCSCQSRRGASENDGVCVCGLPTPEAFHRECNRAPVDTVPCWCPACGLVHPSVAKGARASSGQQPGDRCLPRSTRGEKLHLMCALQCRPRAVFRRPERPNSGQSRSNFRRSQPTCGGHQGRHGRLPAEFCRIRRMFGETRAVSGRVWQASARFGPMLPEFGPTSGTSSTRLAKLRPSSSNFGPESAAFRSASAESGSLSA